MWLCILWLAFLRYSGYRLRTEEVLFRNAENFNCLTTKEVLQNVSDLSVVIALSRASMVKLFEVSTVIP
jgi:hypothetical protein